MINKLKVFHDRYLEIENELCNPEIFNDMDKYRKLSKEKSALQTQYDLYIEYNKTLDKLNFAKEIVDNETDAELVELAKAELEEYSTAMQKLNEQVQIALLPQDENDNSDVFLEVRPAAGGDEASLFGAELFGMYRRFSESLGYKVQVISYTETEVGGLKEGVMQISGNSVYRNLKWESGVHRVQRVPETESQGRVHTSTVTVAVLPELEEVDFVIDEKDLRVDTFHSGGCGGQGVNTTDSAIRLTHIPTGIVVICQDERSQIKNKDKAMKVLQARLQDMYQQQAIAEHAQERKSQVGTGDRSERIRTYNFPQDRVTDHRIGYSRHNINEFMAGDIMDTVQALNDYDIQLKLQNL